MLGRLPLLVGLTFLSVAVGLGAYAIADGIRDRGRSDVLTVTGSAKRRISANYVIWDVSVSAQQPTPAAASREIGGWAGRVRTFLREAGARDDEVTVQPIATETLTSNRGDVVAYKLTRSFQVRSPRVAEIAALVERSSELLAKGIPLAAQPPQYIYTRLPSLRPALLAEATRDALNRARVLVESTDGKLGRLREVNVGVFQVTSPNSTEVSDYGVYDTSTREKDVTAVVNVTFTIE